MRSLSIVSLIGILLAGCAGPMLNQSTEYLGSSIGSLEERQVLTNLGHFVDNPWATPGHVELSSGQVQIQNEVGINLKYPRTWGFTGSALTKSISNEFDLTPAQTQDQESYSLSPITNSEDLRRLRALYHYAVCPGDVAVLVNEWKIADQYYFDQREQAESKSEQAATAAKKKADAAKEAADKKAKTDRDAAEKSKNDAVAQQKRIAKAQTDGKKAAEDIGNAVPSLKPAATAIKTYLASKNQQEAITNFKAASDGLDIISKSNMVPSKILAAIREAMGEPSIFSNFVPASAIHTSDPAVISPAQAPPAAPQTAAVTGGGNEAAPAKGKTGAGDTVQYEEYRRRLILGPGGLGIDRWLYWRNVDGRVAGYCGSRGQSPEYPPHPDQLVSLGFHGGHEFYTDNPKKFSDLVLFVLGGVSNTVGTNILGSTSALSGGAVQSKKTPQCQLLGNYLTCPSKG